MQRVRRQDRINGAVKAVALLAFAGYCCWNGFWLLRGRLPPSIWTFATGLPCPSTGLTRSLKALAAGDGVGFFLYNPFTTAFVLLSALSAYKLAAAWRAHRPLLLPPGFGWLWLGTLAASWIAKFLIGPAYW